MIKLVLSLLFLFSGLAIYAQEEEDYYKDLAKRSKSFEIENLPNLNSKFSSFYVGVGGAFRKPYFEVNTNTENLATSVHPMSEWGELALGLNFNNNFFVETGLALLKNKLSTYVYATPYNPGFTVGVDFKQFYLPVIIKKKVFSLNRVTKNAQLNLGLGGGVLLNSKSIDNRSFKVDLQESLKSPDLSTFYVTLGQSESPIYGEANLEIKGNVTERLEILLFAKGLFRKPRYMENSVNVAFTGGRSEQSYSIFEKAGSLIFGLQIRFNSKKFYRYSSVI